MQIRRKVFSGLSAAVIAAIFATPFTAQAKRVEPERAEKLAQRFAESKRGPGPRARSDVRLKYAAKRHGQRPGGGSGRMNPMQQDEPNDALYYVFNINGDTDSGFVIIAGDDVVRPVLGYSDNGSYDENNLPPNFAYWMDYLSQEIVWAQEQNIQQSEDIWQEWESYSDGNIVAMAAVSVAPLIQTKWNQGDSNYPYNNMCPMDGSNRSITGCVATAMAQIMKYHNYPARGVGQSQAYTTDTKKISVPAVNFNVDYDWNNMRNNYTRSCSGLNLLGVCIGSMNNNWNSTEATAVATLMYHAGVSVKMDYSSSSSGAYINDVVPALRDHFGYDRSIKMENRIYYSNATWEQMLKEQISAGMPVYYRGDGSGGHAFICDGYDNSGKFHFNWGWGGSNDGYFVTTTLNPGSGNNYSNNQYAIINIKPGSPTITAHPSNQTAQSGQSAQFSVTASLNGASSMNYQWQVSTNGGGTFSNVSNGTGGASAIYTTPATTLAMSDYRYRCVITNNRGVSITSNSAVLTVYAPPTISTAPSSQTIQSGQTAQFTVAAALNGASLLTYQWQVSTNGGSSFSSVSNGTGGTAATYTTLSATIAMSGYYYRCVVTNNYGQSVTSNPAMLTVNPVIPDIVWPTAAAITYGSALSTSTLNGGSATVGVIGGVRSVTVVMLGKLSDSWNNSGTNRAALRISVNGTNHPDSATISYGSTSATYTFDVNPGDVVAFNWRSGTYNSECAFAVYYTDTPPSTAFNPTSGTTNDIAALLVYRQYGGLTSTTTSLGSFTVGNGNIATIVAGSFAWDNGSEIPTIMNNGYSVTFTPDDENYESASEIVALKVNPAIPNVTWPTATAITYGDALSMSALEGGGATGVGGVGVSGSFAWTDSTIIPTATNNGYDVTFTPADTVHYSSATETLAVTVIKIYYVITYNLNNGENHESNPESYATEETDMPLVGPVRYGYTFGGWYDNEELEGEPITSILAGSMGNKEFWAKWMPTIYTLSYTLNGGTVENANPEIYNIETETFTLNNSTRIGYTFTGWTGTNGTDPDTTVSVEKGNTGNRSYTANWTINVYTVTFNANGGTVTTMSGTTNNNWRLASLPTPTRTGYTFNGWFTEETGGTQVTTNTVFDDDAIIYARWTPITYTISYTLSGGTVSTANPTSYNVETEMFTLNNPTRTGYTFTGWTGANGTDPDTTVSVEKGNTGNRSYTANWTINVYTVTFKANGGTVTTMSGTTNNNWRLASLPTPTRTGYTFSGWFTEETDGTQVTTSTVFDGDATIYARWMLMPYTISYILSGGTVASVNPAAYNIETETFALNNPTRIGYTFTGWTGANGTVPDTIVSVEKGSTGNRSYTANWTINVYTITFNANGGTVTTISGTTNNNWRLASLPTPTRTGYTFNGWFTEETDGTQITTSTVFDDDAIIYARWTPTPYTITISYNINGQTLSGINQMNYNIETETFTLNNSAITDYSFIGWTWSGQTIPQTIVVIEKGSTGNMAFTANYTPTIYTITFDPNGGTLAIVSDTTNSYWRLGSLPTPTRTGYAFRGWFTEETGGTQVTTSTVFDGDATIYARWMLMPYTISYILNSGTVTPVNPAAYNIETETFALNNPTRIGYTFTGWTGANGTVPDTIVSVEKGSTGNRSFTANWTLNVYTVTFDANGGTVTTESGTTNSNWRLTSLPVPTRTGYNFNGWFTEETGGTQVTASTVFDDDAAVYARWTPITYTISYTLNGGTVSATNPTSYNVETEAFTLNNPTRAGYAFTGWTGANGNDPGITVEIEEGSIGNRSYTANWSLITYSVAYNLNGGTNHTSNPASYTVASAAITLQTPTRSGYTFGGWYNNSEFTGTAVTSISTGSTGDREFWARWTPVSYTISYTLNGGTVSTANPTAYNIETETFALNNPARAGYTFTGWTWSGQTAPQVAVTIEKGSTGNRSYTANWGQLTSVLSPDRAAPVTLSEEAVVAAPVAASSGGFTAGPNIISKASGGIVKIYRVGAAIGRPRSANDNVLTVYDATGNIVNKITVSNNAPTSASSQPSSGDNRRVVGSWDLRDAKGRAVPEGTYLLRGAVRAVDGKRERVSLLVGVW